MSYYPWAAGPDDYEEPEGYCSKHGPHDGDCWRCEQDIEARLEDQQDRDDPADDYVP
jgi:hypothetical protein